MLVSSMEKIKLIESTIEYEKDIWNFRQEILDSDDNDKFAGCGTLERCTSASEWIENCKSRSNKDTLLDGYGSCIWIYLWNLSWY